MTPTPPTWPYFQTETNPRSKAKPQRMGTTWLIQERQPYSVSGSLLFLLLGGVFMNQVVTGSGDLIGLVFGALFAIFFVLIVVVSVLGMVAAWRERGLQRPSLILPQESIHPGERFAFTFQRQFKSGWEAQQDGFLLARLGCLSVTCTSNADTTNYSTEVVWQQEFQPQTVYARTNLMKGQWAVDIPPDLPTDTSGRRQWVTWQLEVMQVIPGLPNSVMVFKVPCTPAPAAPPPVPPQSGQVDPMNPALQDWLNAQP